MTIKIVDNDDFRIVDAISFCFVLFVSDETIWVSAQFGFVLFEMLLLLFVYRILYIRCVRNCLFVLPALQPCIHRFASMMCGFFAQRESANGSGSVILEQRIPSLSSGSEYIITYHICMCIVGRYTDFLVRSCADIHGSGQVRNVNVLSLSTSRTVAAHNEKQKGK